MAAHYEILEKNYIPLTKVKKVLGKRKKTDLTYEQKMALENASLFSRGTETVAKKVIKELKALDLRKLKNNFIVKIADLQPKTEEELKIILSTSKISFKEEETKQILNLVSKNVK